MSAWPVFHFLKKVVLVVVPALGMSACITGYQTPNQNDKLRIAVEPRAEATVTLTDNSTLVQADRISDIVIGVTPGLNIRRQGPRVSASVDYSVNFLQFIRNNQTDERHNLFGLVNVEVIEDHLNIEGRASLRQTFLDRTSGLSGSVANLSANRRLVQNYTGRADYRGRLKDWADINTTYAYNLQASPADNLDDPTIVTNFSDSQSHDLRHIFSSGERFGRLNFRGLVNIRRVTRSLDVNDFVNDSYLWEMGYQIWQRFSVFGAVGYTRNNLQLAGNQEDGFTWNAGFRWDPSRRTSLDASFGREGNRRIADISLTTQPTRRISLTAQYIDRLQAASFQLSQNIQNLDFDEDFGIVAGNGLPASQTNPNFTLSDIDFRQQQLRVTTRWNGRQDSYFISGSYETRLFDDGSGRSISWGGNQGYRHKINARDELNLTSSFRRNEFEGGDRVDDLYRASVEYRSVFSRFVEGSIAYSYNYRDSSAHGADLLENALTIYLRMAF